MALDTIGSKSFSWADLDWEELRRLRGRFLGFDESRHSGEEPDRSDYWKTGRDLASYNLTFGERIGWKWDTVLAELRWRGWSPPAGVFLDWGCGTGVAGRRVAGAWPEHVKKLQIWDRSPLAQQFALEQARAAFPARPVALSEAPPELLLLSHIINELAPTALEQVIGLARQAQAIIWVEAGTFAASRKLIGVREALRADFRAVAPCTHALRCGMLTAENERHWCHHFAKVPGHVHTDSRWGRFSSVLQIDLGTLPFSFLVLDRRLPGKDVNPEASRLIGRARHYKGFAKVLSCQVDGVKELTAANRDAPLLLKELKKDPGSLYRWEREGEKIRSGTRIF